jgi:DNA-binding NtrC family response regulator
MGFFTSRNIDGTLPLRYAPMIEYVEELGDQMFFVAASPLMHKLRSQAELLAKLDAPILIVGESGSGTELIARLIHRLSPRAGSTFLKFNCATVPADVLDTELFGSERRTSAKKETRPGRLEFCDKGTVALDDIADLPNPLQAKLLHLMQERQLFRVGGEVSIPVDVRILAMTKADVENAKAHKKLREDLYYHLSAFTLHVPPLRDRKQEIPFLLTHCMKRMSEFYKLESRPLSPVLLDICQHHSWPGNLAEMENFVKRYLVMGDETVALTELRGRAYVVNEEPSLDTDHRATLGQGVSHDDAAITLLRNVKGDAERSAITQMLEKTKWNRRAAARMLGISYRGLLYKIQQYGLAPAPSVSKQGN